jgi:hypothetical protein
MPAWWHLAEELSDPSQSHDSIAIPDEFRLRSVEFAEELGSGAQTITDVAQPFSCIPHRKYQAHLQSLRVIVIRFIVRSREMLCTKRDDFDVLVVPPVESIKKVNH